jgi:hypothetical protein
MSIHEVNGWKVATHHVNPPISIRDWDWAAVLDDYYDGAPEYEGAPIKRSRSTISGSGRTEAAAIADLMQQIEEYDL